MACLKQSVGDLLDSEKKHVNTESEKTEAVFRVACLIKIVYLNIIEKKCQDNLFLYSALSQFLHNVKLKSQKGNFMCALDIRYQHFDLTS